MAVFTTSDTVGPVDTPWGTVAGYPRYADARRAAERLCDDGFPLEDLHLVGSDLRLVERITGRRSAARSAARGAAAGLWIGLLVGGLLGLFPESPGWAILLAVGAGLGAAGGSALELAVHAAARDGAPGHVVTAARYDLLARHGSVERARVMLGRAGMPPTASAGRAG